MLGQHIGMEWFEVCRPGQTPPYEFQTEDLMSIGFDKTSPPAGSITQTLSRSLVATHGRRRFSQLRSALPEGRPRWKKLSEVTARHGHSRNDSAPTLNPKPKTNIPCS